MMLLIGVVLLTPIIAQNNYTPPTDFQLWEWWGSLSRDEQIEQIRNLDIIEHTIPTISPIEYVALLTDDNELIVQPVNKDLTIRIDYLHYESELPEFRIDNFVPKKNINSVLTPALIGFCIGAFAAIILSWG